MLTSFDYFVAVVISFLSNSIRIFHNTSALSCVCVLGISWVHSVCCCCCCCCTLERQRDCLLRHSDHLFILNFCFFSVICMDSNDLFHSGFEHVHHLHLQSAFMSVACLQVNAQAHTDRRNIILHIYAFECGQL